MNFGFVRPLSHLEGEDERDAGERREHADPDQRSPPARSPAPTRKGRVGHRREVANLRRWAGLGHRLEQSTTHCTGVGPAFVPHEGERPIDHLGNLDRHVRANRANRGDASSRGRDDRRVRRR